jgi:hypothetical protein
MDAAFFRVSDQSAGSCRRRRLRRVELFFDGNVLQLDNYRTVRG